MGIANISIYVLKFMFLDNNGQEINIQTKGYCSLSLSRTALSDYSPEWMSTLLLLLYLMSRKHQPIDVVKFICLSQVAMEHKQISKQRAVVHYPSASAALSDYSAVWMSNLLLLLYLMGRQDKKHQPVYVMKFIYIYYKPAAVA